MFSICVIKNCAISSLPVGDLLEVCLVLVLRTVPSNEQIEADTGGATLGDVAARSHAVFLVVLVCCDDFT